MSQEIKADYKQIMFFPPCVEDWVPANHPARFIREIVEAMSLEAAKSIFRIGFLRFGFGTASGDPALHKTNTL
jgi:transposase